MKTMFAAASHRIPIKFENSRQQGFSLVELMIAMAIAFVILAAMSMVFIDTQSARAKIEKTNRLTENGRYALHVLADDLRLAGYYGEAKILPPATAPTLADYVCVASKSSLSDLVPYHAYGIHDVTSAGKPTCIPESIKEGTDVLVIRRVATIPTTPIVDEDTGVGNAFYFQVTLCNSDPSGTPYVLSDKEADWTFKKKNCTDAAVLREVITHIYYIAANNAAGDGIPTLKRLAMVGNTWNNPEVLGIADGVEEFQVSYGVDSTGDGVPDNYVSQPADLQAWGDAMTAKISLLIRGAEKEASYSPGNVVFQVGPKSVDDPKDGYKRHVFEGTFEMKNALGRREL